MSQQKSIEQIDRNFAAVETTGDTVWYDIRELGVENRGWSDVASFYDRLPARAEGVVPPNVWALSRHSTGMAVRFVARTTTLSARWTLRSTVEGLAMVHMPATGVSGLDLYARPAEGGKWRHAGNARPTAVSNSVALMKDAAEAQREFMLYLPLYNGVESVQIGLPPSVLLKKAPSRGAGKEKPIVVYGTSVTQGGCASRPGMAYTSIMGRWLDREVINLGFSGNGKMEIELAQFLSELDPCMYILDCLGNMVAEQITERTPPAVRLLRKARPEVPIVLIGHIPNNARLFNEPMRLRIEASNAANEAAYKSLLKEGITNLHYIPGDDLYGEDGESTVDLGHPTDLGFLRMAEVIVSRVKALL